MNKPNTINDFIACADYVINILKITTPDQLVIYGRSAGGLLVAAATNARPDLFKVRNELVKCLYIDGVFIRLLSPKFLSLMSFEACPIRPFLG